MMPLHQYWHDGAPPADVAGWMRGIRDLNPDMAYRRHDHASASAYIRDRAGDRAARAFACCAFPAMQADFLRLILLWADGGMWIDAGSRQALRPFADLVGAVPYAFVSSYLGMACNTVMLFRRPGSPYLRACIDVALDTIEQRRCTKVLAATGPGLMSAVSAVIDEGRRPWSDMVAERADWTSWGWRETVAAAGRLVVLDPAMIWDHRSILHLETTDLDPWMACVNAAYRSAPGHWRASDASIYRDAAPLSPA